MSYFPIKRIVKIGSYLYRCKYSVSSLCLFKKGNVNNPNGYRGISLLDVIGKIYTPIITRRITFFINIYSVISESQAGFREGYSAMDNAFVLYSLVNKCLLKKRGKRYVAFVDLTKPFDLVKRSKIMGRFEENRHQRKIIQQCIRNV